MKKVLILVNHDVVIYNFRKELVQQLLRDNYKVYVSSPYGKKIDYLIEMGCEYIETTIERHGTNIISDFKLISEYRKIIKRVMPDVVLSYTIKPNIYGGIACKSLRTPYIATITGLGTALEKKGLMQNVLLLLYKYAFKDIHSLFFQNKENMHFFQQHKITNHSHKLVPGSGVNLEEFSLKKYPEEREKLKILFIGRIMKEKGIEELAEAAKIIKESNKNIEFEAVGFYEEDYTDKANELVNLDIIKFHGVQNNVKEFIEDCNAVILPSYHEGMANVLLESASMGRPIIASSIPGCEETFDDGVTGFGLEPKNVDSLVEAINKFIDLTYNEQETMGILARNKVENEFDRKKVVSSYLNEIENIAN
ncbi:galacturonosyltransferase [Virgibacillus natechei]|uniref:Galacturonosyltransferase n=1 Tax=Virgibacillus natechei TaxID=1216297 RepID=A0ABS4IE25_9BACI|nr:glycosyltransferase family 4 protein [Virgibacillus natechei]MBP1969187.1 galacturonosyltransferase [Virgibacillus natechei]UZD12354.1 glycosyltransferase family 4 protein [Virgibacillus natechei]